MTVGICIVGHGPSLIEYQMGKMIDSHPMVVRVNMGLEIVDTPEVMERLVPSRKILEQRPNYGVKTSAVCYPMNAIIKEGRLKLGLVEGLTELWVNPTGSYSADNSSQWWDDIARLDDSIPGNVRSVFTAHHYWRRRYKEEKPEGIKKASPSTGLEAVVIAMEHFRPRELFLAGYDNMRTGASSNPDSMGPNNPHPPEIEKKILDEISDFYDCRMVHIP